MGISLDLRSTPGTGEAESQQRITLAELPAVLRPRRLIALLQGQPYDAVTVALDTLPPSAVQGAGLLLGTLLRARRVELARGESTREISKLSLLAQGIGAIVLGVPREAGALLKARLRLIRLGRPRPKPAPSACEQLLYLRSHPTLRLGGHYVGGSATHMTGVINGMAANGVRVEVLATEVPEGIRDAQVTPVPPRRAHHLVGWLTTSAVAGQLVSAARDRRADAVYERCTLGSTAGLEVASRLGVPLVLEYNSSELWTIANWGSGRLPFRAMLEQMESRSLEGAALIVVVSQVLKDNLVGRGISAEKILVNPNGVDVEGLAPYREGAPDAWRQRLGLPDQPTVGFIGTFGPWHGTELVPAIASHVQVDHPEARWILIGGGQRQEEVRHEIEARGLADRIFMPGLVAREQGMALLAGCDVCIAPNVENPDGSRFFMSPIKIFEYMGLQKAIVAARLEQIGEVLEDGVTALLHDPADVERAAEQIGTLLSDEGMRRRLGNAAFEDARVRYTWHAHARRTLNALSRRNTEHESVRTS